MNVTKYTVGPFAENTYLLTEGTQALIIDPGFFEDSEYQKVKTHIDDRDLELVAVVLTHAHVDHVLGLQRVVDDFDIPVYLSDKDRHLWNNFGSQAAMFGLKTDGFSFDPDVLPATDEWNVGNFSFDVRYTPGHAPDHVSLYSKSEGMVIAGDALFREGIGRTDLYKGDFKMLEQSIQEQLYSLPDDTVVYPGHGEKTTVGHEKKANPFVKG
jgi:glyoxylase-like metal-dependent hydrolase (beta-lactamase superfamily II)